MNLILIAFMIFGLFAVGFGTESFGQDPPPPPIGGPPPLEPGESGAYIGFDIGELVSDALEAIGDVVVEIIDFLCFWCD